MSTAEEEDGQERGEETKGQDWKRCRIEESGKKVSQGRKHAVIVVWGEALVNASDLVPVHEKRATQTGDLMEQLGLLSSHSKVTMVCPSRATTLSTIHSFHDEEFVRVLQEAGMPNATVEEETLAEYGLVDDCAPFEGVYDHAAWLVAGSVAGAQCLVRNKTLRAVHWLGGRHHAQTDSASGICFLNDIVLAIQCLRDTYARVLYVDLDAHHGDGVSSAYATSQRVYCLSFHRYEAGFFPGSGGEGERGRGRGKGFTRNVPLKQDVTTAKFVQLVREHVTQVVREFEPECMVVQCGVDALAGDPLGGMELELDGFADAVEWLHTGHRELPMLFLGGGGYVDATYARAMALFQSIILDERLEANTPIPDTVELYEEYAPGFELAP